MLSIFQSILDWLASLANIALAILPDSPIASNVTSIGFQSYGTIMSYINYFVPIGTFIAIMAGYTTAVLIYYGIRYVLRWAKYIE